MCIWKLIQFPFQWRIKEDYTVFYRNINMQLHSFYWHDTVCILSAKTIENVFVWKFYDICKGNNWDLIKKKTPKIAESLVRRLVCIMWRSQNHGISLRKLRALHVVTLSREYFWIQLNGIIRFSQGYWSDSGTISAYFVCH